MADVVPIELTTGWLTETQDSANAEGLHSLVSSRLSGAEKLYEELLLEQLRALDVSCIDRVDQLLRRRKHGFSTINQFTAAVLNIIDKLEAFKGCRIDIFAFVFLKYAKNYDLFMVPPADNMRSMQKVVRGWQSAVQALEDFERLGKELKPPYSGLKDVYLKLRAVVSRPSARDEQRTLAVLLTSGPSTLEEISLDLGLNYSLNRRIMTALAATGAIEVREGEQEPRYTVKESALPVVLFLTRETIGLDFLTMIGSLLEEYND
jgi:hypothetical protein